MIFIPLAAQERRMGGGGGASNSVGDIRVVYIALIIVKSLDDCALFIRTEIDSCF